MAATAELEIIAAEAPSHAFAAAGPFVLGRYRLGKRLGAGGFGTVYQARDERLQRDVAVKVIPADGGKTPERARREAQAAARLDHPAVVAVLDAGEDEDTRYLISELVEGESLETLIARDALSDRDVVRVGLALCEALEHAHERGVVHRDVKPANVLVPAKGVRSPAKLCDFGVAHLADEPLTRTGDVVGTIAYMAPEQAAGKRVDERCDAYSAALVIYEALTGVNPVRGAGPADTARRIGRPIIPLRDQRPDLPEDLTAAIDHGLAPRPVDRAGVADLADALADALDAVPDEGGTVAIPRHPLEGRRIRARLAPGMQRLLAAATAGGLTAGTLASLDLPGPPPVSAAAAGVVVALITALLPRIGYLAAAIGALAWIVPTRPGLAIVAGIALAAPPVLLRGRHGTAWPAAAAAPVLGALTLAAAFPALAGQARRVSHRAALGALGAVWLLLGEAMLRHNLALGAVDHPKSGWTESADKALDHVLAPLAASGAWLLALAWAIAAALLPLLVRGRSFWLDLVGATAWAAGTASATAGVAAALDPAREPRGLVVGAIAAGLIAIAGRALGGPVARREPPAAPTPE